MVLGLVKKNFFLPACVLKIIQQMHSLTHEEWGVRRAGPSSHPRGMGIKRNPAEQIMFQLTTLSLLNFPLPIYQINIFRRQAFLLATFSSALWFLNTLP